MLIKDAYFVVRILFSVNFYFYVNSGPDHIVNEDDIARLVWIYIFFLYLWRCNMWQIGMNHESSPQFWKENAVHGSWSSIGWVLSCLLWILYDMLWSKYKPKVNSCFTPCFTIMKLLRICDACKIIHRVTQTNVAASCGLITSIIDLIFADMSPFHQGIKQKSNHFDHLGAFTNDV